MGTRVSSDGRDEHQGLDDLAELGAEGLGRVLGGVGGLGERDVEGDAFRGGGVEDPLDPRGGCRDGARRRGYTGVCG